MKINERTREDRKAQLNRTQKVRDGGLKKIGYDQKVVEGFDGIIE